MESAGVAAGGLDLPWIPTSSNWVLSGERDSSSSKAVMLHSVNEGGRGPLSSFKNEVGRALPGSQMLANGWNSGPIHSAGDHFRCPFCICIFWNDSTYGSCPIPKDDYQILKSFKV